MRMYPRQFPPARLEMPKRRAERQVFEALAESKRQGFAYYEWRRGYGRIELDFAAWVEGLGRFAMQVKGGGYELIDGDWHLKTREGSRLITSCPLDESKLAALDLHDDIHEKAETTYNPFVVPVTVFPDMEPDPGIESLASRKGVYLIWRTDALVECLAEIARSRGAPEALSAERISREACAVTDGLIRLNMAGCRCASIAESEPVAGSFSSNEAALRLMVNGKSVQTIRTRALTLEIGPPASPREHRRH